MTKKSEFIVAVVKVSAVARWLNWIETNDFRI